MIGLPASQCGSQAVGHAFDLKPRFAEIQAAGDWLCPASGTHFMCQSARLPSFGQF